MHMNYPNHLGALAVVLTEELEAALEDLSPSAAALLVWAEFRPGTTATALADVARIKQPTASRVLDGLERSGLIERRGAGGKSTPIYVTGVGQRRVRRLHAKRRQHMEQLLALLEPDQLVAFQKGMDVILQGVTTSRSRAHQICRLCEHRECTGSDCPVGSRATEIEAGGSAVSVARQDVGNGGS